MNVTKENIDTVNAILKINIEKADYEESVKKSLKDYRQKASIPGFRPGKVPAGLIQKRFGKAVLAEEVNKVLSQSISKYIVEEKLQILGEPLPNEEIQKPIDFEKDENFEFVFEIGLAPEVTVSLTKKNKFDYFLIKVDEEMIDQQVEGVANQMGTNVPAEKIIEKSTVRGDFVQLNSDGTDTEEGVRPEGVLLAVDMIKDDAIKKNFVGKKAGDIITFDPVKAYENMQEVSSMLKITKEEAEALDSEFKFTVKEINIFQAAEVNEELFKKVYGEDTDVKTIEDFRAKVKEEIAAGLVQSSDHKFMVDTRDSMVKKNKMELPEVFLKKWLKLRNEELTDEQIEKDFDHFMNDLRWQIISETIVKDNELKVSEEEAMDFARKITFSQFNQYGMYNMPEEQLDSFAKMMLEKEEEKERIYKKLLEDKIMAVVKEKTDIKEKEVTKDEFTKMVK